MPKPRASLWRTKGESTGGPRMSESLAVRRAGTSGAAISDGNPGAAGSRGSTAITRVHQVLDALAARDVHGEILTAVRHFPAREAQWADFPAWTHGDLRAAYRGKGIRQLYSHQAAAAEAVHAGKNVVIVTPTASGKTLCYNLPILNSVLENSDCRALYLFPTKALAQDQLAELYDLNQRLENRFGVFTYDGDTPSDARKAIREKGHIVLTNPDMLHTGILPHHTRWTRLFENLRYIVIDELHTYRGVFGSHLCNVLRRLQRIARFYGREPQFICSSATIANPGELAARRADSRRGLDERAGAGHRRRLAGCRGDGGLPRHDRRNLAARGACGSTQRQLVRRDGGLFRPARSIHGAQSRLFLRENAGTGIHTTGQSGNSGESSEVRGV